MAFDIRNPSNLIPFRKYSEVSDDTQQNFKIGTELRQRRADKLLADAMKKFDTTGMSELEALDAEIADLEAKIPEFEKQIETVVAEEAETARIKAQEEKEAGELRISETEEESTEDVTSARGFTDSIMKAKRDGYDPREIAEIDGVKPNAAQQGIMDQKVFDFNMTGYEGPSRKTPRVSDRWDNYPNSTNVNNTAGNAQNMTGYKPMFDLTSIPKPPEKGLMDETDRSESYGY